jgi:hypothetical protein
LKENRVKPDSFEWEPFNIKLKRLQTIQIKNELCQPFCITELYGDKGFGHATDA